jgi:hypothetical protein
MAEVVTSQILRHIDRHHRRGRDKIVVSKVTGTRTDDLDLEAGDTLYVDGR